MLGDLPARLVVADGKAAERLVIELIRNVLIAAPETNIIATDVAGWPLLRSFLANESARFDVPANDGVRRRDVRVIGSRRESSDKGAVTMAIVLPDAQGAQTAGRRVELAIGEPRGEVVVVPGTARTVDGVHMITAETFGRLRRAESIATRKPVRALILSGWNGRAKGGRSEAIQMLEAWRGPRVPIILDEAARTTAENALWSASLAVALGDVRTVRMVTPWVGAIRLGLATSAALRRTAVRPRLSVVWGRVQAASWRPAFAGLVHLRRHLRAGRALLANGPRDPDARL